MSDDNILNHLFDKTITCPVCATVFKERCVKSKSPRISSKDSDFFINYNVINPYFYDIWICNSCGYAAMKSDFDKIKSHKKDLVLKNVSSKWRPHEYPSVFNEQIAIERFKLALLNAILIDLPDSTKAIILLKIAWMYRLLKDDFQENIFLRQALESFQLAYTNENFPMYGLDKDSLMYLIGDLNRRIENYKEALLWYSKTIVSTTAPYRIKELARNGKDLIKEYTSM